MNSVNLVPSEDCTQLPKQVLIVQGNLSFISAFNVVGSEVFDFEVWII